jgi:invasion protein IalB
MISRIALTRSLAVCCLLGFAQPLLAQTRPASKPAAPAPAAPAPAAPPAQQQAGTWSSRCSVERRDAPLDCAVEQSAYVTNTGQLIGSFGVRIVPETRQPAMVVMIPLGLYLPFGMQIQVDDRPAQTLPLQTCDNRGCFAGAPVNADLLGALKGGKRLSVSFQNLSRQTITIPFSLQNFAEAYQKVQ